MEIITTLILVLICYFPPVGRAVTHWFLDGDRIKVDNESLYMVHTPGDLALFMSQSQAADELKDLQKKSKELLKQRDYLQDVNTAIKEQEKIVFKANPDCKLIKKKLSQFDLYLSSFLRLETKKIKFENYLDLKSELPEKLSVPYCDSEFLFSMYSYDHLQGVAEKTKLVNSSEHGLVNPIPEAKDLPSFGHRIAKALEKNQTSWVLLNFAAIFWRISGNALNAVECLRRALHYSPREHKDLALVSLANILHRSKYSLDAAILMHAALEMTSDYDIIYFTLGNIYGALGQFDLADICYKYVSDLQPGFEAARVRMHAARCEHNIQKYTTQIEQHHRRLQEAVEGLEDLATKQKAYAQHQREILADQLNHLRKNNINNNKPLN